MIEVERAHEGKSAKILSREMTDQMLAPQAGGQTGLGPFVMTVNNTRRFEHSGGNEGFRCRHVGFLDRGQGAVVMTNSDGGNRIVNELFNAIALAYDWPDFVPAEREAAERDGEALDRFVGTYALNVASVATVARQGDRLFLKLPREAELELYQQPDSAFLSEVEEVSGKWVTDDSGAVVAALFDFSGHEVRAKRVP